MHFRLLDLLACPKDGSTPLRLEPEEVVGGARVPEWVVRTSERVCERHCGRPQGRQECAACWEEEVVAGDLVCPECGHRFPIVQGIPSMLVEKAERAQSGERKLRDEQADRYEMDFTPARNRIEMAVTHGHLRPRADDVILEAGAGTGRMTRGYPARCREVVALDFSLASLMVAARQLRASGEANVHLVHGDLRHVPFCEDTFDKYLACGVFQHLPGETAREEGLKELTRVTKPGGVAVLSVYNYSRGKKRLDARTAGQAGEREGHHSAGRVYYYRFEAEELRHWLERRLLVEKLVGFRMPRVERMGGVGLAVEWILQRSRLGTHLGYNLLALCRNRAQPAARESPLETAA